MTNNRRSFLKSTALLGGTLLLSNELLAAAEAFTVNKGVREVGLQLYTIREELAKDVKLSIGKVAGIGYNHVETFYGYTKDQTQAKFWGLDVKELKKLLQDNQLKTYSGHYQLNDFLTKGNGDDTALKFQIEIAKTLGQQYLIVPIPPAGHWDQLDADAFKFMAAQLNKAGEICKQSGLKVGYHNHFWEFRTQANGKTGYDILLSETDPKLVTFELDLFWIEKSGANPATYFNQYPDRFSMWHVKDMDKANTTKITGGEQDKKPSMEILKGISYTEVGTGAIDYSSIFKLQEKAGLKHIFVEQDIIKKDPFVSIKESFNYVKQRLVK